jgi:flagellin
MKTLAVQSANGTYDDQVDRAAIELEYEQLSAELNDISATDFNGVAALSGKDGISTTDTISAGEMFNTTMAPTSGLNLVSKVSLQVGSRTKDLKQYDFNYEGVYTTLAAASDAKPSKKTSDELINTALGGLTADLNVSAKGLGLVTNAVSLGSQTSANQAIDKIDNAINKVSMIRATFGSIQNRLEHKIANLNVTNENLTAAESSLRDTDMAKEMMEFSKNQILQQASQTMLSQANGLPQGALQLLQ